MFSDAEGKNKITENDIKAPALGHSTEKVNASEPGCETEGNIEYWHCNRCGKNFTDAEGANPIENVIVPATGHSTADSKWRSDADGHWRKCKVCGEKAGAAAHDLEEQIILQPDCLNEGKNCASAKPAAMNVKRALQSSATI